MRTVSTCQHIPAQPPFLGVALLIASRLTAASHRGWGTDVIEALDSPDPSVAEHVRRYLATNGESGYREGGVTNLVLTHRGRRTGKLYRTGGRRRPRCCACATSVRRPWTGPGSSARLGRPRTPRRRPGKRGRTREHAPRRHHCRRSRRTARPGPANAPPTEPTARRGGHRDRGPAPRQHPATSGTRPRRHPGHALHPPNPAPMIGRQNPSSNPGRPTSCQHTNSFWSRTHSRRACAATRERFPQIRLSHQRRSARCEMKTLRQLVP